MYSWQSVHLCFNDISSEMDTQVTWVHWVHSPNIKVGTGAYDSLWHTGPCTYVATWWSDVKYMFMTNSNVFQQNLHLLIWQAAINQSLILKCVHNKSKYRGWRKKLVMAFSTSYWIVHTKIKMHVPFVIYGIFMMQMFKLAPKESKSAVILHNTLAADNLVMVGARMPSGMVLVLFEWEYNLLLHRNSSTMSYLALT